MEPNLEKKLQDICTDLILSLRGNQAENGNAVIDRNLIELLYSTLDVYKESIQQETSVSREVIFSLFYTSSRFYIQSKYSNNAADLLKEFERLNGRLLRIFFTIGD
ncbi:hypothetical protein [Paenibacillus sp. 2TAB19]|uniref:hypothetical protein n=1 Tax=Paenibacillus sp. 2TAB19 TaxID=3233003 RepID=UPI003F9CADAC